MKEENTWIDDRQKYKVRNTLESVDSAAHGTSMTHHLLVELEGDSQDEMCISTVIIEDLSLNESSWRERLGLSAWWHR